MESIAQVIRVDEDSMTISARDLHEALRGLSVPELATKARIPQRSMYRKLASPSLFRLDEIRKIAKVSAMTDEQIIEIVRG